MQETVLQETLVPDSKQERLNSPWTGKTVEAQNWKSMKTATLLCPILLPQTKVPNWHWDPIESKSLQ